MKKITQEEFESLNLGIRRPIHPVLIEIRKMKLGEHLFLDFKEWERKTPLNVYLGNYKVREGLSCSVRKSKDGWVITRK